MLSLTMDKYWERKSLEEMNSEEWERLCDGCAKCCLHKLEDEDTGELYYAAVACKLLNLKSCQCSNYSNRFQTVPDCLKIRLDNPVVFTMLPESCAYRRIYEGKSLEPWHPLISKTDQSVHAHGISILGKAFSEDEIIPEEYEDYLITFEEK
ncbi:MAG: YcgN family cysteine cluster protein [Bacteriovoracaceae bacterium]|jgi:uncharacterized protein|nr:YcgN family cysteine cluster protein [Bacteriovoracaceae bacterium]